MLPADRLTHHYSSIPTKDQILVPETLLKKRKSAEKEAADKAAQRETRKKVSPPTPSFTCHTVMKPTHNTSTSLTAMLS